MALQRAVLKFYRTLEVPDFTRLSIEVIEYVRFQNNYFWNDNSLIRHENSENFCFSYCDLSAFQQNSRTFRYGVTFSGNKVTATSSSKVPVRLWLSSG